MARLPLVNLIIISFRGQNIVIESLYKNSEKMNNRVNYNRDQRIRNIKI